MARPKKNIPERESILEEIKPKKSEEEVSINEMPLKTLGDYCRYNERARKLNHQLGICRYKIKPCPVELHPTQRVIVSRNDGTVHPIPIFLSNALIYFKKEITPGKPYDLPMCIVDYLAEKSNPIWGWVTKPDGSKETKRVNATPRFSVRTVYAA